MKKVLISSIILLLVLVGCEKKQSDYLRDDKRFIAEIGEDRALMKGEQVFLTEMIMEDYVMYLEADNKRGLEEVNMSEEIALADLGVMVVVTEKKYDGLICKFKFLEDETLSAWSRCDSFSPKLN